MGALGREEFSKWHLTLNTRDPSPWAEISYKYHGGRRGELHMACEGKKSQVVRVFT